MKLERIEAEGNYERSGVWDEGWLGCGQSALEDRPPSLLLNIEAARQYIG